MSKVLTFAREPHRRGANGGWVTPVNRGPGSG